MNINAIIDAVKKGINNWLFPTGIKFPEHNPTRLLIGCIDARMPRALLGFEPGSTLTKRNIAALVPKVCEDLRADMAATLEFAIKEKKINEIIVLGHTDCGGIGACIGHRDDLHDIQNYLKPLEGMRQGIENAGLGKDAQARAMEMAAVCMSLENLRSYPCVIEAMKDSKNPLRLEGRLLDVRTNKVYRIDEEQTNLALSEISQDHQSRQWVRPKIYAGVGA